MYYDPNNGRYKRTAGDYLGTGLKLGALGMAGFGAYKGYHSDWFKPHRESIQNWWGSAEKATAESEYQVLHRQAVKAGHSVPTIKPKSSNDLAMSKMDRGAISRVRRAARIENGRAAGRSYSELNRMSQHPRMISRKLRGMGANLSAEYIDPVNTRAMNSNIIAARNFRSMSQPISNLTGRGVGLSSFTHGGILSAVKNSSKNALSVGKSYTMSAARGIKRLGTRTMQAARSAPSRMWSAIRSSSGGAGFRMGSPARPSLSRSLRRLEKVAMNRAMRKVRRR